MTDRPSEGDASSLEDPPPTVLQQVSRRLGRESKVSLPDTDSEHAASPLIDSRAPDAGQLPGGRGNYQVLGEIARGGMGVVLKSHDTDLGRDVAMKVLLPEHAERDMVLQRFVEEAQIGGQLQHPGIVPVYEMGLMPDKRPYFTMKLVKGRTLAKLLAERTSVEDGRARFLGIFEKICETLAYAHARNVLHRDLKPANIMVGAFGEVQVVDWGLAKVLKEGGTDDERAAQALQTEVSIIETVRSSGSSSGGSESMVGSIMGTPAYMPPEQAQGEVDLLDERADVFALGAILCQILTGKPPYVGSREEVVKGAARARLDGARERLAACGADDELVQLCLDCMAPAKAARPRSAEPVLERIHAWLASQEQRVQRAQLRAAEAAIKAKAERKARKLTLALAATVLVVGLGGAGFWLHLEQQASDARTALVARVDRHLEEAGALRVEGDFTAALAACDAAAAVVETGDGEPELAGRVLGARALIEAARQERASREREAAERLTLLAALEDVILDEGLDVLFTNAQRNRIESFRSAFALHGIDPATDDPERALAALTALDAPLLLGQALDEYARSHRFFGYDNPASAQLTALARQVDPDPDRNAMRDAIEHEDREALQGLISSEELVDWHPNSVAMLQLSVRLLQMGLDTVPMLRACQRNHPDNSLINQLLSGALQFGRPDGMTAADRQDAIRFATAAWAARRGNANVASRLSWLLAEEGRVDEAIATLVAARKHAPDKDWVPGPGVNNLLERLDPSERSLARRELYLGFADALPDSTSDQNNAAWYLVAWPEVSKEDLDGAVAVLERLVEAEPDEDSSRNSLGMGYLRQGRWAEAVPQLQRSMELTVTPHLADMLGVALALWHLDKPLVAREWIYRARQQRGVDKELDQELAWFWDLADEVMPEG